MAPGKTGQFSGKCFCPPKVSGDSSRDRTFFFLDAKISSNFYHITVTVVARPFDKFPNEELLSLSTRLIFRAKHTHPEKNFLHGGQFQSEKKLVSIETVALQNPQIIFEFSPQQICHSSFFFYAKAPENPGPKTRARSTPGKRNKVRPHSNSVGF